MKIFFTASSRGTQFYIHYYKEIYDEIEKQHHIHIDHDLFELNRKEFYQSLEEKGAKASKEFASRKMSVLRRADICIFEVSMQSTSVGYLISKSLENHKPTIVLYLPDNIPYFLCGIEHEKLTVCEYEEHTLRKVLKKAIELASEKRDQRFNFFINTQLLYYLEDIAEKSNVSKSLYIRKLLESDMKKASHGL